MVGMTMSVFMIVGHGVSLSSGHNGIVVAAAILTCTYPIIIGHTWIQYVSTMIAAGIVLGMLSELFSVPHTVPIVGGTSVSMILMLLMSDAALFLVFMIFVLANGLVSSEGCIQSYLLC